MKLEKVFIGADFPDEFCHSQDKIQLKGANEKAKCGWYRYDTRFGIQAYDTEGRILVNGEFKVCNRPRNS